MEELSNLVPQKANIEEENKLNPDDIKTTILAEMFQFYEEEAEQSAWLDSNPFLKKVNSYLKRMDHVQNLCYVIILWSMIDQTAGWCMHMQSKEVGKFPPVSLL